jgi:hypothetical protein
MSAETAQTTLYAITAVAFVVWLFGLQFLITCARVPKRPPPDRLDLAQPTSSNALVGTAQIDGVAADLAVKTAALLAKGDAGRLGPMKILDRTENRVVFEGVSLDPVTSSLGRYIRRGEIRFASMGRDRTQVDYAVEIARGRGLLLGGAIFQVLGLVALVAGFVLIRTFVVPREELAIRGQTIQMLQVVHFLWPPFLFAGLYRMRIKALRNGLETFIHNLPYTGD